MKKNEQLRGQSAELELLRATAIGRPIGVDRKNNVLRGMVVAQLGPFKSEGRGEFDQTALDMLLALSRESKLGVKSRFAHPTECNDGLGKYLGRVCDWHMGEAVNREGKTVPAVRGDLHFDQTALDTPPDGGKPLGVYVMDLAESDPDALSSSVVIRTKREYRLNPDGTEQKGPNGEELPPLWRPYKLWASDVVDTGDAVDGILSADGLPNARLWKGAEFLDDLFPDASREELAGRLKGWLDRYLAHRFGEDEEPAGDVTSSSLTLPAEPLQQIVSIAFVEPAAAPAPVPDLRLRIQRQREREAGLA